MQQVDIIIHQIMILALLTLTGFAAGRTRYLPENSGMVLSQVVIRITAPSLIVTTMASYDFSIKTIIDGAWITFYALVFMFVSFAAGTFISGLLGLKDSTRNIYRMHSMFGNVGYLALPLLNSLFGEKGLVYAVFFVIPNDTLVWTLGIYLVNRHKNQQWKENLKQLVNANTVSFVLGILFMVVNLQHYVNKYAGVRVVYKLLYDTLNPLGKTTLYITMVFIGLILSEIRIGSLSDLISRYPTLVLSFFKLLVIPAAAFGLLSLLGGAVDPFVKVIVVLELAMPCATIITALAAQYGSDYKFATENVFFTTILGMFTLPVVLYVLKYFVKI